MLRCIATLVALPLAFTDVIHDFTTSNFERLVFRQGYTAAFIKFYASEGCTGCKKLAPAWTAVATAHIDSRSLLVGSVDCAEGQRQRKLCNQHKIVPGLMPTLQFFHMPDRTGTTYNGPPTREDLLMFAARLNNTCSFAMQDECSESEKKWLAKFAKLPKKDLKQWVKSMEQLAMDSQRQRMMGMGMDALPEMGGGSEQMKEANRLMTEMEEKRPETEREEGSMLSQKMMDQVWKDAEELMCVKMVLREKHGIPPPRKADKAAEVKRDARRKRGMSKDEV